MSLWYFSKEVPSEKYANSFNDEILQCGHCLTILTLKAVTCTVTPRISRPVGTGLNGPDSGESGLSKI